MPVHVTDMTYPDNAPGVAGVVGTSLKVIDINYFKMNQSYNCKKTRK